MNSSRREKAAAASAENLVPERIETNYLPQETPTPGSRCRDLEADNDGDEENPQDEDPDATQPGTPQIVSNQVPPEFDLNDFDDDFDDDFEAETAGEYEIDDDEYARALLDIVDFDIEGLEAYRDDD